MEFLRKEDLPYFEKLEEQGQAVIFRLDPLTLMKMDLRVLAKDPPRTDMDEEEVRRWLTEKGLLVRKEAAKEAAGERKPEGEGGRQSVEMLLLQAEMDTEKKNAVIEALKRGCEEKLLYFFLRKDVTAAEIRKFLE